MSLNFILPRPGAPIQSRSPVHGPSEEAFVETFGALLPAAKYLTTGSGKAAYYEFESPEPGSAKPMLHTPNRVLFIHGVQTPAFGLLPLVRALEPSFPHAQFLLVDLWGHGLSNTPTLPHDPSLFLGLIDDLLDHLQWPSAHLVGYSFGGSLAARYVASRPSKVQSFTLIAPAGLIPSNVFSAEEKSHLAGGGDEAAAQKWVFAWLGGDSEVVPVDWKERVGRGQVVSEAVKAWQKREHPGHVASVLAIIRDGGVVDGSAVFLKAAQTSIPSLVVLGALDDICTTEELAELGFAKVFVVPEVGHGVVRERGPEVAGFISDFWSGLDPVSGG
ncbi:alpha/beta-hydrolase [Amniculicola lignicola CBS 123094]|uniref:Alpha/beta-hydrolase n=1 Tax=Amniculicola lignicola CBS 123094 TaxID=1392246 RepID=A0A6A5WU37_9PLEO|nr:alpha/beta-hydrolase [Amniculicola lignicola CBS 123094]